MITITKIFDKTGRGIDSSPNRMASRTKKAMEKAAKDMDFMEAARLRDEMFRLQKELEGMKG